MVLWRHMLDLLLHDAGLIKTVISRLYDAFQRYKLAFDRETGCEPAPQAGDCFFMNTLLQTAKTGGPADEYAKCSLRKCILRASIQYIVLDFQSHTANHT